MSAYADSVARSLRGLEHVSTGHCPGCPKCYPCEEGHYEGEGFSWSECETCDSTLGGDRQAVHGIGVRKRDARGRFKCGSGRLFHLSVCVDCLFFLEYGTEPGEDVD